MPKLKTSELSGPALNYAVALALGYPDENGWKPGVNKERAYLFRKLGNGPADIVTRTLDYDTNPASAWPIIDQAGIGFYKAIGTKWWANPFGVEYSAEGPTSLVAAMRCYVAVKLGDEVEVPPMY